LTGRIKSRNLFWGDADFLRGCHGNVPKPVEVPGVLQGEQTSDNHITNRCKDEEVQPCRIGNGLLRQRLSWLD